jgi:hypothetical protein
MDELIKNELFKNVDAFLNELDLTMEYLDPQIIPSIRKYIKGINSNQDDFKLFLEYTTHHLGSFQPNISAVLFSNKKIKSNYYNFLNNITLFNKRLNFRVFENESKNTKKGLIKYIYSIYMSSVFLHQTISPEGTTSSSQDESEVLTNKLAEFVNKIQKEAETALKEEDIKPAKASSSKHKRRNAISNGQSNLPNIDPSIMSGLTGGGLEGIMSGLTGGGLEGIMSGLTGGGLEGIMSGLTGGGMGGMEGIMESILGNKEMLNIATDISQKMHSQELNPMSMLSSLMSGNIENTPLQGLVEEIQQKVENKINSGEIDKEKLEDQAKNIMGSITSNPSVLNSMPGMSDLINNMVKDMGKQG